MELKRTVDQWENCDPESMAYHMSQAAIMYAFKDARHDILRMHDEITRLRAELAKVTWQRNEAQADLAASRAESERLSSMIDHQRDEAVEMERMLRAELADSQSECGRMTELCRRLYGNLGDVKWCATEDGSQGKGTGRHIACFVLTPNVGGERQ